MTDPIVLQVENMAAKALERMKETDDPHEFQTWSTSLRNCASALASLKGETTLDYEAERKRLLAQLKSGQ